ncbi:MAG: hypothetical protein LBT40_00635 [Deltaproteobacteria bacterium]|jgi:hypothetical protein|nr:hypothetical protein [Deltaproteobacteria bacterium]
MSLKTLFGILAMFAALALVQTAAAQDGPADPNAPAMRGSDEVGKPGAATPDSGALDRLAVGVRLAAIGRETKSPYALAAAAEILSTVGATDADRKKEKTEGGEAPAAGAQPTAEPVTDAKALFAEAAALANAASNAPLAAQIEQTAAAAGSRGTVVSYARHSDRVNPYATDVYRVRYRGNETARAVVEASYGYDIDLYVYSNNGNLVVFDNDLTNIGICYWTPARTSDYFLNVKNTTSSYVSYVISTD